MSPCELWLEFEISALRRRDDFERDTVLAWQVNRIYVQTQNEKRLPTLQSLLEPGRQRTSGRPSPEMQKAMLMNISRQYGIPMREVKDA